MHFAITLNFREEQYLAANDVSADQYLTRAFNRRLCAFTSVPEVASSSRG